LLRAAIRENERFAALSKQELTKVFQLKSQIQKENKDGISSQSAEGLVRYRQQMKELIGEDNVYHQLTDALIVSLYYANNLPRAEQVARELAMAGKMIGDSSAELGRALSHLGFLLACQGKLQEADELLTKSVAINCLHPETQRFAYLDSVDRLAYLRLRQGQTIEAILFSGAAMSGYKRAMKTEECKVATAHFTWGMANLALQQKNEARKSLERFSELAKGKMVPDHPMVLEAQAALKRLNESALHAFDSQPHSK
jgi:tetratricopeptide (TPR) repeat protein